MSGHNLSQDFKDCGVMIDLHSHILPGVDDGAADLQTSLAMARAYVADGVAIVACTPHILPGVYANSGPSIRSAVAELQAELDRAGIALRLVAGADVHITPGWVDGLRRGDLLSIADSRYVLVELPRHVAPPRFEAALFDLVSAGYVPILTHPERLLWLSARYDCVARLVAAGVWVQVTAGALAGHFGARVREIAERLLDDGLVHILATDAHGDVRRRPDLRAGFALAGSRVGQRSAWELVATRPRGVIENMLPESLLNLSIAVGERGEAAPDSNRGGE